MCATDTVEILEGWIALVRDPVTRAAMDADGVTEAALLDLLRDVCQRRGCPLAAEGLALAGGGR